MTYMYYDFISSFKFALTIMASQSLQTLLVTTILMTAITIGESTSEFAVDLNINRKDGGPSVVTNFHTAGNTPTGFLSVLSSFGDLYTIDLSQHTGTNSDYNIIKHQFLRMGTNSTSNPFSPAQESEGSAATLFPTLDHNTVYDVLHHHAYIVHHNDIIILNLNAEQTSQGVATAEYLTLSLGQQATEIKAYNIGGEHYICVYYTIGDRGYVRMFRRYPDEMWGFYGAPEAVITPSWFSNSHLLSNVLLYQPPNQYSLNSINVAVGYEYYIHVNDLLDRTYYSEIIPPPCNSVEHMVYNRPNHLLFVVCHEASFLYNYTIREFYDHRAPLEDISGKPYFNHNGNFGAIVCNLSDSISNITVIQIVKQSSTLFHHLTNSLVAQATFVDVGPSKRYFCYLEIGPQNGIKCIDVKATFSSRSNDTVVIREVPNSQGLCPSVTSSCPPLYTHHSLLIAQNCTNDDECEDGIRAFDLATFTNVWNLTGVEPFLMLWKSVPRQSPPTETLLDTTTPESQPTTESETAPQTTIVEQASEPTKTPSISVTFKPNASLTAEPITLEVCQAQLASADKDYDRLLWITIGMCVFFCVALAVTVVLVIAVISVNRMGTTSTDNVSKKKAREIISDSVSIETKSTV